MLSFAFLTDSSIIFLYAILILFIIAVTLIGSLDSHSCNFSFKMIPGLEIWKYFIALG